KANFLPIRQLQISATRTFRENSFARFILRDDLAERRAFWRGIFRMRMIVVKTRAVRKHEVAFDFLETERAVLVDLVISRLVSVLHQCLGAKAARIEMRILEL